MFDSNGDPFNENYDPFRERVHTALLSARGHIRDLGVAPNDCQVHITPDQTNAAYGNLGSSRKCAMVITATGLLPTDEASTFEFMLGAYVEAVGADKYDGKVNYYVSRWGARTFKVELDLEFYESGAAV